MFEVGPEVLYGILRGCPLLRRLLPSGVVDVLFTDVEGSTRRWSGRRDRDGWRSPPMIRCCARRSSRGGWVFKHTGDGGAASPQRGSAVDAAVASAAGVGVAGGRWASRPVKPSVGPNTSVRCSTVRRGYGRRPRRSDPLAESTAVLLSGVDLVDLGPRRLRDLPTPVGVFQGPSARPSDRLSGVAGAGCGSGEPAPCGHQPYRARIRGRRAASGGEGSSVGDVDGGGRGRQDSAGDRGGGAAGR